MATLGLVWFYCQHLLVWTEYGAKSWSSLVMTSRAPQREKAAMKLIAWLARIMLAFYLDLYNRADIFQKSVSFWFLCFYNNYDSSKIRYSCVTDRSGRPKKRNTHAGKEV